MKILSDKTKNHNINKPQYMDTKLFKNVILNIQKSLYKTNKRIEILTALKNSVKGLQQYILKNFKPNYRKDRCILMICREPSEKDERTFSDISDSFRALYRQYPYENILDVGGIFWVMMSKRCCMTVYECYSLWANREARCDEYTDEDNEFIYRHGRYGTDWIELGAFLEKPPFDVFKRFKKLERARTRSMWSAEEDDLLRMAALQCGEGKWCKIANIVKTKNPKQCLHRYRNNIQADIKKGRWTKEEDSRLIEAINLYGSKKWNKICEHVASRNDSQCRERYVNVLDPDIKKTKWTADEDKQLLKSINIIGVGNWKAISDEIYGRTDAMCRRRYYKLIEKKKKKQTIK